jgi:glycosyltransferase involved in cell wall biosynthesis
MATFNGERYVQEQLSSILAQLGSDDEVIVVDDASSDATVSVVDGVQDARVRLYPRSKNAGYVSAFEEAISRSRGDFVLLSDQDDVWIPGRVDRFVRALGSSDVVASNMVILGSDDRAPWWMPARQGRQWRRNVLRILAGVSGYYGCGMGIRQDFVRTIAPFPAFLTESHDLWLALAGNLAHSIALIEEPTLRRRVHQDNVTPTRPRSLGKVLAARMMLLRATFVLSRRIRRMRTVAGAG